ncbi:hypothetical protein ASE35_04630 [Lysobacter sp. Root916]|uniref:hypothetical protein n=1 Tax=Lysobacter sp. Root916 TaxID=1736606 RepID=UPI00070B2690|nr:hypothetical protein [Lysobacter sp. Root916]KRD39624.1 hypothetical protein ASE35_04630 [Lysobacter sp. Root916]
MSRLVHIARMRARLERAHWPRLQMATVVAITGGVGFVASYVLLRGGMDAMWQRYPLAVAIAYAVFLLLLWLWARFFERKAYDWLDLVPDGGGHSGGGGSSGSPGGGGHSGGGGASASFEVDGNVPMPSIAAPDIDMSLPELELPDALGGVEEGGCALALLLLVATVALGALLLTVGWVVWIAPTLMAELILDVALAGSLYRRLRRIQTQHWLRTALRRTIWPVLGVALTLAVLGYAGTRYAPGADSIGDVVAAMRARE